MIFMTRHRSTNKQPIVFDVLFSSLQIAIGTLVSSFSGMDNWVVPMILLGYFSLILITDYLIAIIKKYRYQLVKMLPVTL